MIDLDISFISSYTKKDGGVLTAMPMSAIDIRKTNSGMEVYVTSDYKNYSQEFKLIRVLPSLN